MRRMVFWVLCLILLGACAAHAPRCGGRLEPINPPGAHVAAEAPDGE